MAATRKSTKKQSSQCAPEVFPQAGRHADKQAGRQAGRQAGTQTSREAGTQTSRDAGKAGRQISQASRNSRV